jgi:hypothetical protein
MSIFGQILDNTIRRQAKCNMAQCVLHLPQVRTLLNSTDVTQHVWDLPQKLQYSVQFSN